MRDKARLLEEAKKARGYERASRRDWGYEGLRPQLGASDTWDQGQQLSFLVAHVSKESRLDSVTVTFKGRCRLAEARSA